VGPRYAADLDSIAWYAVNSQDLIHPVAGKAPNASGFYDMLGNLWEWCQDLWDKQGSIDSIESVRRVIRGGSWSRKPEQLRISLRYRIEPTREFHPRFPLRRVQGWP